MARPAISANQVIIFNDPINIVYPASIIGNKLVKREPTGANRSDTFPTAKDMFRIAIRIFGEGAPSQGPFVISFQNTSHDHTVTLVANTGLTITGTTVLLANSAFDVTIRFSDFQTCVANVVAAAGASQNINGDLLPAIDNTYNLGNGTFRWAAVNAVAGVFTAASSQIQIQPGGGVGTSFFINAANPGSNKTITLPDPGINCSFALTSGNQAFTGTQSFGNTVTLTNATNQLVIQPNGSGNAFTFNAAANPSAGRAITLYDPALASVPLLFGGTNIRVFATSGSVNILTSETGGIFLIPATAGALTINMANGAKANLWYRIYVSGTLAGGAVTISSTGADINGTIVSADGTTVTGGNITTAKTSIILGTGITAPGDSYELIGYSGGYLVRGMTSFHTAVTFA